MRLRRYINELAMKHGKVEVTANAKSRFKTTIYAEIPNSEDRIFKEWLFFFEANLVHSTDTIVYGFSPHMSRKTMMKVLDKNIPEWKEQTMGALKAVHFGYDPTFQDLEKEALTEWRHFAVKELEKAGIDGIWELEFQDESGNVEISPKEKGVAIQLFAGIEQSVKIFANKYKPSIVIYEAAAKEKSKVKLYETLGRKILKSGYIEMPPYMLGILTEVDFKAWGFIKKDKMPVMKEVFGL